MAVTSYAFFSSGKKTLLSSCSTRAPAHLVSSFSVCRVPHTCSCQLRVAHICITPSTTAVPTVRLGRAKPMCTAHTSVVKQLNSRLTPLNHWCKGTHHLLHLRTDVECKVFLASEALVCLIHKLISLISSFALHQWMAGADHLN